MTISAPLKPISGANTAVASRVRFLPTHPVRTMALAFLSVLALSLTGTAYATVLASHFSSNAEGWIGIPGQGALAFVGSGGNPGGHVRVTDIGSGGGALGSGLIAPGSFLGDLSEFVGGTLSVDMRSFAGSGTTFSSSGLLRISGAGDVAFHDLNPGGSVPPFGTWATFSTSMTASAWGKTQSEWSAILANVTELAMGTDAFDGAETIGVDNFKIASAAVPEPPTVLLLAFSLAGLAVGRRLGVSRLMSSARILPEEGGTR